MKILIYGAGYIGTVIGNAVSEDFKTYYFDICPKKISNLKQNLNRKEAVFDGTVRSEVKVFKNLLREGKNILIWSAGISSTQDPILTDSYLTEENKLFDEILNEFIISDSEVLFYISSLKIKNLSPLEFINYKTSRKLDILHKNNYYREELLKDACKLTNKRFQVLQLANTFGLSRQLLEKKYGLGVLNELINSVATGNQFSDKTNMQKIAFVSTDTVKSFFSNKFFINAHHSPWGTLQMWDFICDINDCKKLVNSSINSLTEKNTIYSKTLEAVVWADTKKFEPTLNSINKTYFFFKQ